MTAHCGREAIALLSGQACAGEANIVCPSCRSDHTNVFNVFTQVSTDQRAPVRPSDDASSERRTVMEIAFSCEHCPHHFAIVIQQFQGSHLVAVYEDFPNFTD